MKKLMVLLLCALTLLSAASCGSGTPSETSQETGSGAAAVNDVEASALVDACVAAYDAGTLPTIQYYRSGAQDGDDDYLDPGYAGVLFYDEYGADVAIFDSFESYAMATPVGKRIFEIDVIKVNDESVIDSVMALYKERLDRKLQSDIVDYAPEEYPYLSSAEYYNIGNYVIFISTTDNSAAKNVITEMLTPAGME